MFRSGLLPPALLGAEWVLAVSAVEAPILAMEVAITEDWEYAILAANILTVAIGHDADRKLTSAPVVSGETIEIDVVASHWGNHIPGAQNAGRLDLQDIRRPVDQINRVLWSRP